MGFTYEKKTAAAGPFIEITGYEGEAPSLTVPDEIEGLPVRSIGNHALADRSDVREITLPRTLKTLHLFAFQNDANLEKIRVFDTADDCYDGVIRSCDALREIAVEMTGENNYVLMRELLQDTDNALSFLLHWPAGEGKQEKTLRLTFPEYVREAREDTMARAIHFTIEGAGMAYRECVEKHALLLTEYDRLLPRLTSYDDLSAAEICLDRLMYPEALGEAARAQYETWLLGHTERVLLYLIDRQDADRIRFLSREHLLDRKALEKPLQAASEQGLAEICAMLMEAGGGSAAPLSFDLDEL